MFWGTELRGLVLLVDGSGFKSLPTWMLIRVSLTPKH